VELQDAAANPLFGLPLHNGGTAGCHSKVAVTAMGLPLQSNVHCPAAKGLWLTLQNEYQSPLQSN
jgi:hypothetical protein